MLHLGTITAEPSYNIFSQFKLVRSLQVRGKGWRMEAGSARGGEGTTSARSKRVQSTNTFICVVDDDRSMSRMLSRVLTAAGFEVVSFTSAEEFLDSKLSDDTACLILDMNLPGMSGLDLQQLLNHRQVDIPIIFVSADADDWSRQRVLEAGAAAFLAKPFGVDSLLETVRSATLLTLS